MAKQTKVGTAFQKDVQDSLAELTGKRVCTFVRLYDTTAARGMYIPKQPGDFIVASHTGGHLLEVKASEVHSSLRSCLADMLKPHQAAGLRLWKQCGQPSWVLFYSKQTEQLELWDGAEAGICRATGGTLPRHGETLQVGKASLTDLLYNALTRF